MSFCIELFCVVTLQYQILVRIAIAYFIIEKKKAAPQPWQAIAQRFCSTKSLEDALLLAKGRDVYISGGYGLFKEALQIVDKMYITEVDLNIEDGDTFFPEFDINDFEVLIGETLGEEVKYTRTFYVRKNELQ